MPGVFPPVELLSPDGGAVSLHVDGGVSALVPTAGSLALHPTRVYVLDVASRPLHGPLRSPVAMLVRSLNIATRLAHEPPDWSTTEVTHIACDQLTPVPLGDFTQTRRLMAQGEAAALAALGAPPVLGDEGACVPTGDEKHREGRSWAFGGLRQFSTVGERARQALSPQLTSR